MPDQENDDIVDPAAMIREDRRAKIEQRKIEEWLNAIFDRAAPKSASSVRNVFKFDIKKEPDNGR